MPLRIEASAIDALQFLVRMFMDSFRMSLITGDRARSSAERSRPSISHQC